MADNYFDHLENLADEFEWQTEHENLDGADEDEIDFDEIGVDVEIEDETYD